MVAMHNRYTSTLRTCREMRTLLIKMRSSPEALRWHNRCRRIARRPFVGCCSRYIGLPGTSCSNWNPSRLYRSYSIIARY